MKHSLFTLLMGFSFIGVSCQGPAYKTVGVEQFMNYITDADKVTLLDVRTPPEHAEGYIPGTDYNIDVLEDNYLEVALEVLPIDKPVAVYCRSGNRSKNASVLLAENGYEVVELATGIRGWTEAGNKLEKPSRNNDHSALIKSFITKMYNEGLYNDYDFIRKYCSKSLLRKLQKENEYYSEGIGYATWIFRSCNQDGISEENRILEIKQDGKWYTYTALDMGIKFTNRIKITVKGDKIVIEDVVSVN